MALSVNSGSISCSLFSGTCAGDWEESFSGERAADQSEERTRTRTEYTFPSQTDLALQCILWGGGNIFSFEENLILVKLHCFDSLRTCASSGFPKTNGSGSVQLSLGSKSDPAFFLWAQKRSNPPGSSRSSLSAGSLPDLGPQERLLQQAPHCCSLLVA